MADKKDFSWQVNYGGDPNSPMSLCFTGLNYHQSMVNGFGVATHTFQLSNKTEGGRGLDTVPPMLQDSEIEFELINTDGSQRQKWRHLILGFDISYDLKKGYPMTLRTVELKAKMNFDARNRAHRIEQRYTDKVREIVQASGLTPDVWEDQDVLPEHRRLRQLNLSDYEWIVFHVLPRMDKGYYLYSTQDSKVCLHSAAYQAETYSVAPELYTNVCEQNDCIAAVGMGGGQLKGVSYNPFEKKFLTFGPHDSVTPSFGTSPPLHVGERIMILPCNSQEALEQAVKTRHAWFAYQRQGIMVEMRGHIPEGGWWKQRKFDLSATKYKNGSPHTGFTRGMVHAVSRGQYIVSALCGKDQAD